mmetsp:Transcript_3581/g.12854  ORF Transcript_3581/g.12854 Transcript_3581/m.12854 type:complete len:1238 (+) Transcript_3581:138-3851(+)
MRTAREVLTTSLRGARAVDRAVCGSRCSSYTSCGLYPPSFSSASVPASNSDPLAMKQAGLELQAGDLVQHPCPVIGMAVHSSRFLHHPRIRRATLSTYVPCQGGKTAISRLGGPSMQHWSVRSVQMASCFHGDDHPLDSCVENNYEAVFSRDYESAVTQHDREVLDSCIESVSSHESPIDVSSGTGVMPAAGFSEATSDLDTCLEYRTAPDRDAGTSSPGARNGIETGPATSAAHKDDKLGNAIGMASVRIAGAGPRRMNSRAQSTIPEVNSLERHGGSRVSEPNPFEELQSIASQKGNVVAALSGSAKVSRQPQVPMDMRVLNLPTIEKARREALGASMEDGAVFHQNGVAIASDDMEGESQHPNQVVSRTTLADIRGASSESSLRAGRAKKAAGKAERVENASEVPAFASQDEDRASGTNLARGSDIGGTEGVPLTDAELGFHDITTDELEYLESVLVVETVDEAKRVAKKLQALTARYHACDTEVKDIEVREDSPCVAGVVTCISIYCGPDVDFSTDEMEGRSCIWVDTMNPEVLLEFKEYFEDPNVLKVWHNYGFDRHVLANHGIHLQGFGGDTLHMARLLDSSKLGSGSGYALDQLTRDEKIMQYSPTTVRPKTGMKEKFSRPNVLKNGTLGKKMVLPSVEELQEDPRTRLQWIHYSALDAEATWQLRESLHRALAMKRVEENVVTAHYGINNLWDLYEGVWRPFGEILTDMEKRGIKVNRAYLEEIEARAADDLKSLHEDLKDWIVAHCPEAYYMNSTSDEQLRVLFFGGMPNKHVPGKRVPRSRVIEIANPAVHADGKCNLSVWDPKRQAFKKKNTKNAKLEIKTVTKDVSQLVLDSFTDAGWPAVSESALKHMLGVNAAKIGGDMDEESLAKSMFYQAFNGGKDGISACKALSDIINIKRVETLCSGFILPLQGVSKGGGNTVDENDRIHCSMNLNTETGRLSARRPNLQNQPALEKDIYKIRSAFVAEEGNTLIVADYGQLELRLLAHVTSCESMLKAFRAGGDFHSRTALGMYPHIGKAVEDGDCLLEWDWAQGDPPVPLLKDLFAAERRKAKTLNFSIAYGKTAHGLAHDWEVSKEEAEETLQKWYSDRPEVKAWQEARFREATEVQEVSTLLGRKRQLPGAISKKRPQVGHAMRASINTPIQGGAADVVCLAMIEISRDKVLEGLGWQMLLQIHDEVILEGPKESAEEALERVKHLMQHPFGGVNLLQVDLNVDANCASDWYSAK